MQIFELTVFQTKRLVFGIIAFSISIPAIIFLTLKTDPSYLKIIIRLMLLLIIIGLVYFFAFGKLILRFTNDRIDFEMKKRFSFDDKDIEPVNVSDIKTLIVDEGMFLRKIITDDRIININSGRPVKKEFILFIETLMENVESNNGRVN